MVRFQAAVLLALILLALLPVHGLCSDDTDLDQILYLNSYDYEFSWSKLMASGVHDGIYSKYGSDEKPRVYILTEFMDSKLLSDETHFENLYNLLSYKLKDNKPRVIIVSDDNALRFIKEYGEDMFPGVPVVFTGINDYESILEDLPENYTGIIEKLPIEENIEFILKLHPNLNTIYLVTDDTFSGKVVREQVEDIIKLYEDKIEFKYPENGLSADEMLQEIQELPDNSAVFFITYNSKNDYGDKIYPDRYITSITKQDRIPVYSVMGQYNEFGIAGGCQISAYDLGKWAAYNAMEIINGTDPNDIPVETDIPYNIVLNYESIEKFDIKNENIPLDVEFFNVPSSDVTIPKNFADAIIVLIFSLAAILVISLFYNNKLKKTEIELKNSLVEKNMLLREIHHRVNNNLAIISSFVGMQVINSKEPETQQKLRDVGNRIISMSIVYDNLCKSENFSGIEIRNLFLNLGEKLIQDYSMGIKIDFEVNGEKCLIIPDKAVPLSLVINEIIGNSLKFAFEGRKSGKIQINYNCSDEMLNIEISDDGIGIDKSYIENESESIGISLIRNIMSFQLKGNAEVRNDGGTIWIISFPRDNN